MNDLVANIQEALFTSHSSELSIFVGIILLSYLLEDLAIVTAASLSAQEIVTPMIGLLAAFIGIASGDLSLYFLGRLSTRFRLLRYKTLTNAHLRYLRKKLQSNPMLNLFIIRFIPGLRTIGFTLSGVFHIRVLTFLTAVMSATAVWTALVFPSVYFLGSSSWIKASEHQWLLIPIMTLVLFATNRIAKKKISKELT
ncbi:DedA family protein [Aliivibrio sp. SR45-2]|uniref:DedA family protein n=1 Tax=Aliivibrio sp. SR45-2 TaxID=2760931 RepID=UPI0015FBA9A3|nr:DedA family protein [Aliivibrio sp. SR45-2]MBB1314446.1 DedA family protein [Aliivibrio sp. SR45-2]